MSHTCRKIEGGFAVRLSRLAPVLYGVKILFVLLLSSTAAQADPVGMQFRAMKVPDLVEAVVKGILKRDYVITPEVGQIGGTITLSVAAVERGEVVELLNNSMASVGVAITDRAGVLYVEKLAAKPMGVPERQITLPRDLEEAFQTGPQRDKEAVAYFPLYRTAEILAMAAKTAGATVSELKDGGKRDAVVYAGSAETVAKVAKLLTQLDQPRASLNVKAALLEVTESDESTRSIDAILNLLPGKLGLRLKGGAQQSNAITMGGLSLSAILSAVDGDSRFKYLSEPSVRVLDGETATITVGANVPTRGNTTVSNGQTVQGVEYRTAGVVLTIEPRILGESIILRIDQQVSSVSTTNSSGIDSPTINKRQAQTVVDALEGEVIIIGGMDETKENRTASGLAWLPAWLGSSTATSARSQVLLLLEVTRHQRPAPTI